MASMLKLYEVYSVKNFQKVIIQITSNVKS